MKIPQRKTFYPRKKHWISRLVLHEFTQKNPEISVILPVYNAEKYIRNSIESILHQSFKDFELIIINDGSIDNSGAIISSFNDVRIHYYTNDTNLGLIKTLNKSINLSKGRYIARMDADDICMPNRFEKQVAFMESHPSVVLCGTWAKIIDDQGKSLVELSELIPATWLERTCFSRRPFFILLWWCEATPFRTINTMISRCIAKTSNCGCAWRNNLNINSPTCQNFFFTTGGTRRISQFRILIFKPTKKAVNSTIYWKFSRCYYRRRIENSLFSF